MHCNTTKIIAYNLVIIFVDFGVYVTAQFATRPVEPLRSRLTRFTIFSRTPTRFEAGKRVTTGFVATSDLAASLHESCPLPIRSLVESDARRTL